MILIICVLDGILLFFFFKAMNVLFFFCSAEISIRKHLEHTFHAQSSMNTLTN